MSQAYRTVAELVPVAESALAGRPHDDVVRDIRRALLRLLGGDVYQACDIAATAIVCMAMANRDRQADTDEPPALADIRLASDYPDYGDDLRPPGGKQL